MHFGTISLLLLGLTLVCLISVSAASARVRARASGAETSVPERVRRASVIGGCFEPPPEPVAVPPCADSAVPGSDKPDAP